MTKIIRDDFSERLVHLTRGDTDALAADNFLSILTERKLRGSSKDIKGGFNCVCFSEAPICKLAHLLADTNSMRYMPFGVMVTKQWLFDQGGRPVIYQPTNEFDYLNDSHKFRHVRYEPPTFDFTWEREWRIQTDELPLDPNSVTLVVPNRDWERWALREHSARTNRAHLITHGLGGPGAFPWHFIVLDDLGVSMPPVCAPPA